MEVGSSARQNWVGQVVCAPLGMTNHVNKSEQNTMLSRHSSSFNTFSPTLFLSLAK